MNAGISEVISIMEQSIKLESEGLRLIEQGGLLHAQAREMMNVLLGPHAPSCPVSGCGGRMEIKVASGFGGRPFWSCERWTKHASKDEKCTINYAKWLKETGVKLAVAAGDGAP